MIQDYKTTSSNLSSSITTTGRPTFLQAATNFSVGSIGPFSKQRNSRASNASVALSPVTSSSTTGSYHERIDPHEVLQCLCPRIRWVGTLRVGRRTRRSYLRGASMRSLSLKAKGTSVCGAGMMSRRRGGICDVPCHARRPCKKIPARQLGAHGLTA
ncbi:hypothetical protein EDB86DRAFT_255458 [Lactarius hatsudake]|nr:hypothetical protein EDB86DRAFT_255458 [Lactarius hatsudake]